MTGATFITPFELEKIMSKVEKGECVLLDIRSAAEFRSGHIRYAKLIPLDELERRAAELDPGKTLVIYCRSGRRCMPALAVLNREGHGDIRILEGGLERWQSDLVRD